jgi:hypothetical protein
VNGPWNIDEAASAANLASAQQKGAEQQLREAAADLAEKERAYRQALAQTITRFRADGHAATVCADLARGDKHVSDLRYHRDVAQGVLDAASQAAWRLSADRRTIEALTRWSMGREFAEHGQDTGGTQPAWTPAVAA